MRPRVNAPVFLLGVLACVAAVALSAVAIAQPLLVMDDFQILAKSWTWRTTWIHLWVPQNEHIMPLGRVSTWLLTAAVGRVSWVPLATALHGPAALVLGMILLYIFVRRELGESLYGLVAMTLFGASAVYQQAVYWFASSFSILALDTMLLGLLAAQRYRQTGCIPQLAFSVVWCALAPGWFASGILAGPFCFLYLLAREDDKMTRRQGDKVTERHGDKACIAGWAKHLVCALAPLMGTILFLGIVFVYLRPVVEQIRHLEHYAGKTAEQSFHPLPGAENSARSILDNLLPGLVGVWGVEFPRPWAFILFPLFLGAVIWWSWLAPRRRLCVLGLAMIATSYWLVYSARAEWDYSRTMNKPNWSRYHLLPQLGLTLLIVAGLAHWPKWFQTTKTGRPSGRQIAAVLVLIGSCFLVQLPRSIAGQWQLSLQDTTGNLLDDLRARWADRRDSVEEQQAVLRQIEEMDVRCRQHRIQRETAQAALPWLEIPHCYQRENGWEFLWGSPEPLALSVEEAGRILGEDKSTKEPRP